MIFMPIPFYCSFQNLYCTIWRWTVSFEWVWFPFRKHFLFTKQNKIWYGWSNRITKGLLPDYRWLPPNKQFTFETLTRIVPVVFQIEIGGKRPVNSFDEAFTICDIICGCEFLKVVLFKIYFWFSWNAT